MTIEGKFKRLLFDSGMSEDEAEAVMEIVKADSADESMRWSDAVEDYPAPLHNLLWAEVKRAALKYVDANCPQAWFRPMFTQEAI